MLTATQVGRMVEAADLERAFFVLNETSYAEHISGSVSPFNFHEILKAELDSVHTFLEYTAGDDDALRTFWRKYDYGNAKLLLRRSEEDEEVISEKLLHYGNVKIDQLTTYIMKGEGRVPIWLDHAVGRALLRFEEEKKTAGIDDVLDEAYFDDLALSGNALLMRLAKLWSERPFPFDSEGDRATIDLLRQIKRKAFGIEPLITFWLAKVLEARFIRVILAGKKHHVKIELLKEYVRETYV